MYKSPIELLYQDCAINFRDEVDEKVYEAVQKVGIHVDKEELIKALAYDREQYNRGYADGYTDGSEEAKRICMEVFDKYFADRRSL